jgi:hypothetical protein
MATVTDDPKSKPAAGTLIRLRELDAEDQRDRLMQRQVPALAVSGVFHIIAAIIIAILAWYFDVPAKLAEVENTIVDVRAEERPEDKPNLTNEDVGLDPTKQTNYNIDRIETQSVPGVLRPEEPPGIKDAPNIAPQTVTPPPGVGGGAGGGADAAMPGVGNLFGDPGGFVGGRIIPGQMFGGRSGATREKMVAEGGGNAASEAAVAKGLAWLKRQQKPDGRWTMVDGRSNDDFGATGLALLPFLAAGVTHKIDPNDPNSKEYSRTVDLGLRYLVNKQQGNGLLGTDSTFKHYSHAICTIALCEAVGMSGDAGLRRPAQRAIDYLVKNQHNGGGWRYFANQPGDTSVTAWCLQALQSGKLAGLAVPPEAFYKCSSFLDSMQTQNGAAYGYTTPGSRPTLTAACLLARAYLGWGPKNPAMMAGIENLKKNQPQRNKGEIYYYYYATQVMHFCAPPDDWHKVWNPKMRDLLVDTQDNSTGPNRGSWAPEADTLSGSVGGRMYQTSLSLLTLEVYYRHLPLYKRDTSGLKDLE